MSSADQERLCCAIDWIEQAKGVLAATRGVGPDEAFQQLRKQARSSSRKLADLAQGASASTERAAQ